MESIWTERANLKCVCLARVMYTMTALSRKPQVVCGLYYNHYLFVEGLQEK